MDTQEKVKYARIFLAGAQVKGILVASIDKCVRA